MQGEVTDSISNHLNVKAFIGKTYEILRITKSQKDEEKKHIFALRYIEFVNVGLGLFGILNVVLIFYTALKFWQTGEISTGDVVFVLKRNIQYDVTYMDCK